MKIIFLAVLLVIMSAQAQKDQSSELIQRMNRINELEEMLKLQNQATANTVEIANLRQEIRDQQAQQNSAPSDIAVLKEQMTWSLRILSATVLGLIGWAIKQMRKSSEIIAAIEAQSESSERRHQLIVNDLGRLVGKT